MPPLTISLGLTKINTWSLNHTGKIAITRKQKC